MNSPLILNRRLKRDERWYRTSKLRSPTSNVLAAVFLLSDPVNLYFYTVFCYAIIFTRFYTIRHIQTSFGTTAVIFTLHSLHSLSTSCPSRTSITPLYFRHLTSIADNFSTAFKETRCHLSFCRKYTTKTRTALCSLS